MGDGRIDWSNGDDMRAELIALGAAVVALVLLLMTGVVEHLIFRHPPAMRYFVTLVFPTVIGSIVAMVLRGAFRRKAADARDGVGFIAMRSGATCFMVSFAMLGFAFAKQEGADMAWRDKVFEGTDDFWPPLAIAAMCFIPALVVCVVIARLVSNLVPRKNLALEGYCSFQAPRPWGIHRIARIAAIVLAFAWPMFKPLFAKAEEPEPEREKQASSIPSVSKPSRKVATVQSQSEPLPANSRALARAKFQAEEEARTGWKPEAVAAKPTPKEEPFRWTNPLASRTAPEIKPEESKPPPPPAPEERIRNMVADHHRSLGAGDLTTFERNYGYKVRYFGKLKTRDDIRRMQSDYWEKHGRTNERPSGSISIRRLGSNYYQASYQLNVMKPTGTVRVGVVLKVTTIGDTAQILEQDSK